MIFQPTPAHPLPSFSLHCEELLLSKSAHQGQTGTAVASVVQPESPAGRLGCSSYIRPLYAERRYESCTDISRVMQAFWLPSGFGRAAVGVRGGDWVTGPSSSWQPPKGEFLERRRTFCSLAKSFRSGRGRRASLNNNCSHTKAVDERLTQDLGSAEIFRD